MNKLHLLLAVVPFMLILLAPLALKIGGEKRFLPVERAALTYDTSAIDGIANSRWQQETAVADSVPGPFGPAQWKPPVAKERKDDFIRLSFILIDEDEKIAILNNTIVREGGEYAGMTLTTVEKGRVALTRNGVTQWIILQK